MGMKYVGPELSGNDDVTTVGYLDGLKATDLDADGVDARILSNYAPYADRSYVDAQDALLANADFINAGDSTRIRWDQREVTNGVAGLGATGRVIPARINMASNQRWVKGFWSPSSYNATDVDTTTGDTVYTCGVTNPGYSYKLVVFGTADLAISGNIEHPIVEVRVGSATGDIIARGTGANESYLYTTGLTFTEDFNRTTEEGWGDDWALTYSGGPGVTRLNGTHAIWERPNTSGVAGRTVIGRRLGALESQTITTDQRIIMRCGDGLEVPGFDELPAGNSIYMRMSADQQSYVRALWTHDDMRFYYRTPTSGGEQPLGDSVGAGTSANNVVWEAECIDREYNFYRNGSLVRHVVDTLNQTTISSSARGWGCGLRAGNSTFTRQVRPAHIDSITIEDAARRYNTVPATIIPVDMATQAVKTGGTTLYVRLRSSGSTTVSRHTTFLPSLYVLAIPA